MPRARWQVVQLYRYKRADVVSAHWWRWTALLALSIYSTAEPHNTFDAWRT